MGIKEEIAKKIKIMFAVSGVWKGEQGERSPAPAPAPAPKPKKGCRHLVLSSWVYTFGEEAEVLEKFSEKLF